MSEKNIEVQKKQEIATMEGTERTREGQCYVPRSDVYENGDEIVIVADMPGVEEKDIDISLEKNILTINGYVQPNTRESYTLTYGEYGIGDYQRRFALSNEIDIEKIKATVKAGVLRLYLPKGSAAKTRKITVKPG
jgi:HSP20 family protein